MSLRSSEENTANWFEGVDNIDKKFLPTRRISTSNNVGVDKRFPRSGLPTFRLPIWTSSFRLRRPWQRRQRRQSAPLKTERKQDKFGAAGKTGKNFRWGEKKKS